jgi:hypothetical protein
MQVENLRYAMSGSQKFVRAAAGLSTQRSGEWGVLMFRCMFFEIGEAWLERMPAWLNCRLRSGGGGGFR